MMETTQTDGLLPESDVSVRTLAGIHWVYPEERFSLFRVGANSIGRDPEVDIHLDDRQVSRRHATILYTQGQTALRDDGSRNKTHVNGAEVKWAVLSDNDVVRVGSWVGVVGVHVADEFVSGSFGEPLPGVVAGPRTRLLWQRLALAAQSNIPIVLQGETGTGKEVFAGGVHALSRRAGPLVAVNCSALTDSLAEAQLFGHVRGAFTGAVSSADGYFAAAHGGTLFLDEVADLALPHQAKLLRAVETLQVTPVGSTTPKNVNARIVCATQAPLWQLVELGRFRSDLMARVNGLTLQLPPLRARREEVFHLFRRFLGAAGSAMENFKPLFVEGLCLHDWPLNVRELAQAAKRCQVISADFWPLAPRLLPMLIERRTPLAAAPESVNPPPASSGDGELADLVGSRTAAWYRRHRSELQGLLEALERRDRNVSRAASDVGMSRQRAQRLLAVWSRLQGQQR